MNVARKSLISVFTFGLLYIAGEVAMNLMVLSDYYKPIDPYYEDFVSFNKKGVRFDSVSGYRWYGENLRYLKIYRSHVVIDNTFTPNEQGYISNKDYQYNRSGDTIRIMVLGDSYTGPDYLQVSWPDRVQELINKNYNPEDSIPYIELFPFALSGSGIFNWHSIYFNEIVPYYEFDGLVIATYGDNLNRDFGIMDAKDGKGLFNWFSEIPENHQDYLDNYIQNMWELGNITDDDYLEMVLAQLKNPPGYQIGPYFFKWLVLRLTRSLDGIGADSEVERFSATYIQADPGFDDKDIDYLISKYGHKKIDMLKEIIDHCNKHGKQVIISSIPEEEGIALGNENVDIQINLELEFLAENYNALFFDGYRIFSEMEEQQVSSHFIPFDGHWSQKGSDKFAVEFSNYLSEQFGLNN